MIVVIGGGLTGLALGRELLLRQADFVVLEKGAVPGGVIRSEELDGHVLDWGPQRARLTPAFSRLVEELDLRRELLEAPDDLDLLVYAAGRLHRVPLTLGALVRSDVVGARAKLRMLLEPLTRAADPEESVATCFRRKVGDQPYERLLGPFFGGLYGSDPEDMRVGHALAPLLELLGVRRSFLGALLRRARGTTPRACTFARGMQTLPRALAASLGERLRLDTPVHGLRRAGSGWRVELADGDIEAEQVVLCTAAPAAAGMLGTVAPEAAAAVSALRYNPIVVAHLLAETELRGIGFQVSLGEPTVLRGVTFHHSLFGRTHQYTAFLGGARHAGVARLDPRELAAAAAREFRACTGYGAEVIALDHVRMPAWDRSWDALRGLRLPEGIRVAGSWWSRPGILGRLAEAARTAEALGSAGHAAARSA